MMNGWLIYRRQDTLENRSYIDWFIEEATYQDISLTLIYREALSIGITGGRRGVYYHGHPIELPSFAVVRVMEPMLNTHLEAFGIAVFNNKDVSFMANDKIRTHHELQKLGIPMVDTIYMNHSAMPVTPPLPFPFVLKEAKGRGGEQVFFLRNQDEWKQKRLTQNTTGDFLVQRCNVELGTDIRVFVVGKEMVGAVKRTNQNDFRANYKLGGTVTWYTLSIEQQKTVDKIIDHFAFGMVGIDFLTKEDGTLLFNEIEDVVGSRSLSKVSQINILQKYVTHIKNNV